MEITNRRTLGAVLAGEPQLETHEAIMRAAFAMKRCTIVYEQDGRRISVTGRVVSSNLSVGRNAQVHAVLRDVTEVEITCLTNDPYVAVMPES